MLVSNQKIFYFLLSTCIGWLIGFSLPALGSSYHLDMVADINPGNSSGMSASSLKGFGILNDQLYFSADDGIHGKELYVYNGVTVEMVADIYPGMTGSSPVDFTAYASKLFFGANNSLTTRGLFSYDGNVVQHVKNYISPPTGLTVFNDDLYYSVQSTAPNFGGVGFHKYNGSTAQYLANIGQGLNFIVNDTIVYDNELFLEGRAAGSLGSLLRFDGTSVSPLEHPDPNSYVGNPQGFAIYNGDLYFGAPKGPNFISTLFKYDGNGITEVTAFNGGTAPVELTVFNGQLYFQAADLLTRSEIFKYDGQTASLAFEITPGLGSSLPEDLTVFNGELFFTAVHPTTGRELYKFDGSTASLVTDINPGSPGSNVANLFVFNDQLFFVANDGVHGTELFKLSVIPEPATVSLIITCIACYGSGQHRTVRRERG
jgi:ELWxxDGT repeat protein